MSFHTKYRPENLEQIIGHEAAVTRMLGMIKSGKVPSSIAIFGPTSAGKTTLGRAFAAQVNGLERIGQSRDYIETNAAADKSIESVRQIEQQSKFRAQHKRRFILIDEAHGLLSNPQAANAILKTLEEPAKDTTFIICSMEPAKFSATETGRAMLNRCSQFVLKPHSPKELLKQAVRIAKREKMSYVLEEGYTVLKDLVRGCSEMRTVANMVEALSQYYDGLEKKPKRLTEQQLSDVIASTESADDALAATVMAAVYNLQFKVVQRSLLDVQEPFTFVNKLMWANSYILNSAVLEGKRHRKVWPSKTAKDLMAAAGSVKLGVLAATNACLVEAKIQIMGAAASPEEVLSFRLYRLIIEIKAMVEK